MLLQIIILSAAGFVAAFVDSIAGGGGLISLPAFLAAGVPAHLALGTNKFASTAGSFTSSLSYARSDKVNWELLKYLIPVALVGAVGGVQTVLQIDQSFLNILVLLLIVGVGVYTLLSKDLGAEDHFQGVSRGRLLGGVALALGLGFYDGFFGPGTGSFLMFGLIGLYGFDFVRAGGKRPGIEFHKQHYGFNPLCAARADQLWAGVTGTGGDDLRRQTGECFRLKARSEGGQTDLRCHLPGSRR